MPNCVQLKALTLQIKLCQIGLGFRFVRQPCRRVCAGLNEELVQLLLIRDELHMEQDAMLVDIEDLTR